MCICTVHIELYEQVRLQTLRKAFYKIAMDGLRDVVNDPLHPIQTQRCIIIIKLDDNETNLVCDLEIPSHIGHDDHLLFELIIRK